MIRQDVAEMDDLAERMDAGEERAYAQFAELFGPRFRRYFLGKGLPAEIAEDLAVSCITDIALRVDRYHKRDNTGFEAWVFTLLRHAWADWWRTQKDTVALPEQIVGADPHAVAVEPDDQVVAAVRDALECMSTIDREIIELRDLGGETTYCEIAGDIGVKEGTARQRHRRALKRLESLLLADPRVQRLLKNSSQE